MDWAETGGSTQNRKLPDDGLTSRSDRNKCFRYLAQVRRLGVCTGKRSSRSIAPLFINSGNRHVATTIPAILLRDSEHLSFVRIERDSQNCTRRRSRSGHPIPGLPSIRSTTRLTLTEICWKSRCSAVMVSSDAVIHLVLSDLHRNTICWSFVALERSIRPGPSVD